MLNILEAGICHELDLQRWYASDNSQKAAIIRELFHYAQKTIGLTAQLSFAMPDGFEAACGLTHPVTGDICVNASLWDAADPIEPLFYFLHELRHSIQISHPEWFPDEYSINNQHIIQFDGTGYKIEDNQVKTVKMKGEQAYFTELYLSAPCERDANAFAHRCLKKIGATGRVDEIYRIWLPKFHYFGEEEATARFLEATAEIDRLVAEQETH